MYLLIYLIYHYIYIYFYLYGNSYCGGRTLIRSSFLDNVLGIPIPNNFIDLCINTYPWRPFAKELLKVYMSENTFQALCKRHYFLVSIYISILYRHYICGWRFCICVVGALLVYWYLFCGQRVSFVYMKIFWFEHVEWCIFFIFYFIFLTFDLQEIS